MSQNLFVKSPLPVCEPVVIEIKELSSRIYFGYYEYFKRVVLCYQIVDADNNKQTHFGIDVDNWIKHADICMDPECNCDRFDSLTRSIYAELVAYHIMVSNDLNNSNQRRQISKDFLAFVYGNKDFGAKFYEALHGGLPKFIGFAQKPLTTRPQ